VSNRLIQTHERVGPHNKAARTSGYLVAVGPFGVTVMPMAGKFSFQAGDLEDERFRPSQKARFSPKNGPERFF